MSPAPFLLVRECPKDQDDRLVERLGWDVERFEATFDVVDLVEKPADLKVLRTNARVLIEGLVAVGPRYRGLVVLGKRASKAFQWLEFSVGEIHELTHLRLPYICWRMLTWKPRSKTAPTIPAVVLPHPSNVNPWWVFEPNCEAFLSFTQKHISPQ